MSDEIKARTTKEELIEQIESLKAQLKDKDDQIAQHAARAQAGQEGWDISTPNPKYTGRTGGVWFENGHAFVSAQMPEAHKIVRRLIHDFGYSATATSAGVEVKEPERKKKGVAETLMQPHIVGE